MVFQLFVISKHFSTGLSTACGAVRMVANDMSDLRPYISEFPPALLEWTREADTLRGGWRTRPILLLLWGGRSGGVSLLPMLLHLFLFFESGCTRRMPASNLLQLALLPVLLTTLEVYKLHPAFWHGALEHLSMRREVMQVHLIATREHGRTSGVLTRDFLPCYKTDIC